MHPSRNNLSEGRVVSIDALRGFDMFWIVGGGTFFHRLLALFDTSFTQAIAAQMHHPEWHGFTVWDLIFPLFLFLVGASLPFALSKRISSEESRRKIYLHVLKRALILYFLGMIMEVGRIDALGGLRYTGVLHRIAFCYFFTSVIVMNTHVRGQIIWMCSLLFGYWLVLTFVPVPGFGAGNFSPEGNLASYLDRLIQPGALHQELFDNEGFLSTFPAVATTLLGVLAGQWLKTAFSGIRKAAGLCLAGILCLVSGLLWDIVFPINKLLWTSSFVLVSGGLSLLLLALFYWLIDVRRYRRWAFPFVVIGMNAITIYFVGAVFSFGKIVTIFTYEFSDYLGMYKSFFTAFCVLAVKWFFLYYLYRKDIFLKA